MKHFDLFSGIGGFALAARHAGWRTTGFCEIDPYCRAVLQKHWPKVPIYNDIRELRGEKIGKIDVLTGGYPCQPFSTAGKRQGEADDRHLWPEFDRLISKTRPTIVVAENVVGHASMGLDQVLSDLENQDYAWRAFIIPACAVNAPHRRERIWVVAHSNSARLQKRQILPRVERKKDESDSRKNSSFYGRWDIEPRVGRVVNGLPGRVDRIRGLGNSVVPQVAAVIFNAINEEVK